MASPAPGEDVEIVVEDPSNGDAAYCLAAYFEELDRRFEGGFDVSNSLDPDAAAFAEPSGLFLVARRAGRPIGCSALKFESDDAALIKRMWVSPEARGLGLGKRLLVELESQASRHGAKVLRLETNRVLTEAIGLYRSWGFVEVDPFNDEPFAHHWFEKHLPSQ